MIDRIVDASAPEPEAPEELQLENSLRPQDFAITLVRSDSKEHPAWLLKAAKKRQEALDHVLPYGPPGRQNDYGQRDCQ